MVNNAMASNTPAVAIPAQESLETEYIGRSEAVNHISKSIVFNAAVGYLTEGDRLSDYGIKSKPKEIGSEGLINSESDSGQVKRGFIGRIVNATIRSAEALTGVAQARIIESQLSATRAIEKVYKFGVDSLNPEEISVLNKLGLQKYAAADAQSLIGNEIEAAKKISKVAHETQTLTEVQKTTGAGSVLKALTHRAGTLLNAADSNHLTDLYLRNVSIFNEKKGVNARNWRLAGEVSASVALAVGTKMAGPVLGALSLLTFTGIRAYQRSKVKTEKLMNTFRIDGFSVTESQKYTAGQGVNQTLAWSTINVIKKGAQKIGKFYSAEMRMKESSSIQRFIDAADIQILVKKMQEGDEKSALRILALAGKGNRAFYNTRGNTVALAEAVVEAQERYELMEAGKKQALERAIAEIESKQKALESRIQIENLTDTARAVMSAGVLMGLKHLVMGGAEVASAAEQRHAHVSAVHKSLVKGSVKINRNSSNFAEGDEPHKVYMPLIQGKVDPHEYDAIEQIRVTRHELGGPGIRSFSFDSNNANDIAHSGHAFVLDSHDRIYSNVMETDPNKRPDFEIHVKPGQGNGDGYLRAPANQSLELFISSKYHEKVRALLESKGLVKGSDYKPENIGYRLYIKNPDGSNTGIVVTRDSNITGITVTEDGKLIVAPDIHTKIDGVANVYVDKDSGGNVVHVYNLGRYINKSKVGEGKPSFIIVDKGEPGTTTVAEVNTLVPESVKGEISAVDLRTPDAGLKLEEAGAHLIPQSSVHVGDSNIGSIMYDEALRRGFQVSDVTKAMHFSDSEGMSTYLPKAEQIVNKALGTDMKLTPDNIKWAIEFKMSDGKWDYLIVDKSTRISGISVKDNGLYISPDIGWRAAEVTRIAYTGKGIVKTDALVNLDTTGKDPVLVTVK